MITALPPPPVIEQPVSNQMSFGVVSGRAAAGTTRVIVRVGPRVVADKPLRQRLFQLRIQLPTGESTVQIVTVSAAGRRSSVIVPRVIGASPALPRPHAPRNDPLLSREIRRLTQSFAGTSAVYIENLATGAGASWNARATFPAASSLKLAIAVTALARTDGTPAAGSTLDRLLRQMLTFSDNAAANATERYFGGSTSGGSALVNSLMRSIGLVDTEMYGGYTLDSFGSPPRALAGPIPLRIDSQPSWGYGKKTSAYDLAALLRAVWLAGGGKGPLRTAEPGFSATDARYLLYLLAHVRDPGKLDREVSRIPGVRVLHKAGWINDARHDNGIVFWSGGAYVVSVMTYRAAGVGVSSDVLAGRVASAALRRFRG